MRLIGDARLFYPGCIILSACLHFLHHYLHAPAADFSQTFLNIIVLSLTVLTLEKLIILIYKGPYLEIRALLFLFLFLSPYMQINLAGPGEEYYSIFFLLFSVYNYSLSIKYTEKGFVIISLLGILFSTYFFQYSFIAAIPLLLYTFLRNGWWGLIYFVLSITLIVILFNYEFKSFHFIALWSIKNIFTSGSGSFSYNTPNIIFSFFPLIHPVFFIAGIIALPLTRPQDFEDNIMKILLVSYLFYGLFIAGLPFQHYNMLAITFPMLLILLYPALTRVINLTEYFRPTWKKYLPYYIISAQLILMYLLSTGFFKIYI